MCSIELGNSQRYSTFKVVYKYIVDLVSEPKFVFNDLDEAIAKLEEVRQGLCADIVREHHESCESYQLHPL